MTQCSVFIDCSFKYSGWRNRACCIPAQFDSEGFDPYLREIRSIMESDHFNSGIEFVHMHGGYLLAGSIVWVDSLKGCEPYGVDRAGRRLPCTIGIQYKLSDQISFPTLELLSDIYKSFVSDRYEMSDDNNDCFFSDETEMNLKTCSNIWSKSNIEWVSDHFQAVATGYGFLFDQNMMDKLSSCDHFLYVNCLPKKIDISGENIVCSRKSFFGDTGNMIRSVGGMEEIDYGSVFHVGYEQNLNETADAVDQEDRLLHPPILAGRAEIDDAFKNT